MKKLCFIFLLSFLIGSGKLFSQSILQHPIPSYDVDVNGMAVFEEENTEKPTAYLVLVFNMYGSIINQFKCSEFAKFDLTGYPKGVYTLSAYTDQTFIGSCKIVLY